jgi:peptidyl-prolyl cis-trans isomerase SurA
MPRRLLGIWVLLLVSVLVGRAQGDVVLLTVNDEAVTRSEFEYHFRNSLEKRVDVFLETYGRFKQKVFVAKELGLDTLLSHRRCVEDLLLLMKDQDAGLNISGIGKEWVQLKVVTYPLKQSVGNDEISRGKCYMDSLYNVWQESSFQMEIPSEVSWLQARFLLDEWQKELKNLNRGEWSKPFFSPLGIHLIAWLDRRQGNDFHPEFSFSDSCLRKKGMEEGLLVASLNDYLQAKVTFTEKDLDECFQKNRLAYGSGIPHFRGAVIHCRNKKDVKAIKKYLKKYPDFLWEEMSRQMPAKIAEVCRIEVGLFRIGENPYVDKLAFGCGEFETLTDYPYTWVLGKRLKKGPKTFQDVRKRVEIDCLEAKKKDELEALMKKYRVEIDKEVLKTVNRAENK